MGKRSELAVWRLMGAAVSLSALSVPAAAHAEVAASQPAQTANSPAPEAGDIIVTGSRVRSKGEQSIAPVQVISGENLKGRGQIDVGTFLQQLPAARGFQQDGGQILDRANAGIFTINLRGLGDSRTLVLIDGRRMVPGTPGSSSVDLNTIPTNLIGRIEILTGGASAIYGSDAVAGVVNIITRKDVRGIELNAQVGADQHGDGLDRKLGLLAGAQFANGRGFAELAIEYDKTDPISSQKRWFSKDYYICTVPDQPSTCVMGPAANRPTQLAQGIFALNSNSVTLSSLNRTILPDGTITTPDPARDGINWNSYYDLQLPVERVMVSPRFEYSVTDSLDLFANALISKSKVLAEYPPSAWVTGSLNLGGAGPNSIRRDIPVDNPFIPAALKALIPAGRTTIAISRDFPELGPREFFYDRQTIEMVAGAKGTFNGPIGDKPWNWQVYYQYGRSGQDVLSKGGYNTYLAYESQRVTTNGAGQLQCADPVARALGCIPINLFSGNRLTPAEIASIATNFTQHTVITQQVAGATLDGRLFELPAGPVNFAVGAEWRKETSDYNPDKLFQQGFSSLGLLAATHGKFDVKELFGEVRVPLLRDLGPLKLLEVEGAVRWADYSTTGPANTWKFGGSATLFSDLMLRAELARAVRAPNIGELYAAESSGQTSVIDPCVGGGATPALEKYCLGIPGITAAFNPGSPYRVTQTTGGNPNLQPERGNTLTLGAVYSSRWIPGLSISADYYNIDVKNAVSTLDLNTIASQCANTADPRYCALVHRDSTGLIQVVDLRPINAARLQTTGLDIGVNFQRTLGRFGSVSAQLAYSHMFTFKNTAFSGTAPNQYVGRPTYPADSATMNINYKQGPLTVNLTERYKGAVYRIVGETFSGNRVSPITYTDMQVQYAFSPKISAYVGGRNIFDAQPPLYSQSYEDGQYNSNTPSGYDVIGRFLYAGINLKY